MNEVWGKVKDAVANTDKKRPSSTEKTKDKP